VGSIDPVNPVSIDKVEQIHAVDGIADGDSNQPRSALVTIRARASDAVLADPRTPGVALPGTAFAERMFHGLEKYQAQAREGERNGRNRALLLDAHL
jgi:hypothetical protein